MSHLRRTLLPRLMPWSLLPPVSPSALLRRTVPRCCLPTLRPVSLQLRTPAGVVQLLVFWSRLSTLWSASVRAVMRSTLQSAPRSTRKTTKSARSLKKISYPERGRMPASLGGPGPIPGHILICRVFVCPNSKLQTSVQPRLWSAAPTPTNRFSLVIGAKHMLKRPITDVKSPPLSWA